jgi:hypothetical protein
MDEINCIEVMGIMSSDDGREPITVFLQIDSFNGRIKKAHKMNNIRTAPIL